jgi:hypothetical protein
MKALTELAGAVGEKLGLWYHAPLASGLEARNKIVQRTGTNLCKPTATHEQTAMLRIEFDIT